MNAGGRAGAIGGVRIADGSASEQFLDSLSALSSGVLQIAVSGGVVTASTYAATAARIPFGSGTNGGLTDSASLTYTDSTKTFLVTASTALDTSLQVETTNTGQQAYLEARVSGATGQDPQLRLTVPTGTSWYVAVDNTGDVFDVGTGTAVGSARYLEIVSGANAVVRFGPDIGGQTILTAGSSNHQILTVSTGGASPTVTLGTDTAGSSVNVRTANVTRLTVTSDGRFFGTSVHNNAGAMTGTVNQYFGSGTYTPTLTNVTNVAASTARKCQWNRVGNVVTVSGSCDIDPTAAGATQLGISLPIASNLALATDLGGDASADSAIAIEAAAVRGDLTNDRAEISYTTVNIANHTVYFIFMYEVL